jgi:hypothetical protein
MYAALLRLSRHSALIRGTADRLLPCSRALATIFKMAYNYSLSLIFVLPYWWAEFKGTPFEK